MRIITTKTDFNLVVYPGGKGFNDESALPHKMYFPDQETKDAYVKSEWKFCEVERAAYLSAMERKDRKEKHVALLARRAFYAQKCGYYPSMKDTKQWYYKAPAAKVNA